MQCFNRCEVEYILNASYVYILYCCSKRFQSTHFQTGKERLEKEFHSQLSRQSKPLTATRVLELIDEEPLKGMAL